MKKSLIKWILVLMSISLIGIIAVQLNWIKNAVKVNEEKYENEVRSLMMKVASRLQMQKDFSDFKNQIESIEIIHTDDILSIEKNGIVAVGSPKANISDSGELRISGSKVLVDGIENAVVETYVNEKTNDSCFVYLDKSSDALIKLRTKTSEGFIISSGKNIGSTIQQFIMEVSPVQNRMNFENIDSLIQFECKERGLPENYEFAVKEDAIDSTYFKSENFVLDESREYHKTNLFPDDYVYKSYYLYLYFNSKTTYLLRSIFTLLTGSIFFTLIILVTFSITIFTIIKQKKLSEIKSDFINNMTHEFKTPIATISLATDSIINPKIIDKKDQIHRFIKIIKEENQRMNNQVESVLQMSLLEKEKFNLEITEINIDDTIFSVLNNLSLKIEENGGELIPELNTNGYSIEVDKTHFSNVISNLVDNACKYSNANLKVVVTSRISGEHTIISVEDNGIGIKKEDQVRIFDKFYRVSTGNVHNVKGFGLGLSYVKTMIEKFGGTINVTSELGKGSRFDIKLPIVK